jgi:hypothetical protein
VEGGGTGASGSPPNSPLSIAFSLLQKQSDPSVASQLACASGLYCLEQGRYRAAALKLTEVALDIGQRSNEITMAPQVGPQPPEGRTAPRWSVLGMVPAARQPCAAPAAAPPLSRLPLARAAFEAGLPR